MLVYMLVTYLKPSYELLHEKNLDLNELNNDTYKQIKQLKDELRVIQAFNIYEATQSDSDYNEYASTQAYYKNLYGKNVDNCSEQKVNEDMSIIISLLPSYYFDFFP